MCAQRSRIPVHLEPIEEPFDRLCRELAPAAAREQWRVVFGVAESEVVDVAVGSVGGRGRVGQHPTTVMLHTSLPDQGHE